MANLEGKLTRSFALSIRSSSGKVAQSVVDLYADLRIYESRRVAERKVPLNDMCRALEQRPSG